MSLPLLTSGVHALTLAAGASQVLPINGDFIHLFSSSAALQIGMNTNSILATANVGYTQQGQPNAGQIRFVFVKNNTGGAVPFVLLYGTGQFNNPANVTIQNPNFTLSAGDKDDIRGLPQTLTPALQTITTNTTITAGKRSVSVANVGAANITLAGDTLAPGQVVGWSAPGRFDTLAAIAINATGSSALVSTLA